MVWNEELKFQTGGLTPPAQVEKIYADSAFWIFGKPLQKGKHNKMPKDSGTKQHPWAFTKQIAKGSHAEIDRPGYFCMSVLQKRNSEKSVWNSNSNRAWILWAPQSKYSQKHIIARPSLLTGFSFLRINVNGELRLLKTNYIVKGGWQQQSRTICNKKREHRMIFHEKCFDSYKYLLTFEKPDHYNPHRQNHQS